MKKLLFMFVVICSILLSANSFAANFSVCTDRACFTGALTQDPAPQTQDFSGYPGGNDMNGVEFIPHVYATSSFANLTVGGAGMILYGFDDVTRQNGNGYYDIHVADDNVTAIGFDVAAWDPASSAAVIEVDFHDGTTAKFELEQKSSLELTPVFFGMTADTVITKVRVYEPFENNFPGNEEIGLDNFVVGSAFELCPCGYQGGTSVLPISDTSVTVFPLPGVTLKFEKVTEPNSVSAVLIDPAKIEKLGIDPKTQKGWKVYEEVYDIWTKKAQPGPITVILKYKDMRFTPAQQARFKIAHYDKKGKLTEILKKAVPVDVDKKMVAGETDSLSPFAVVLPLEYSYANMDFSECGDRTIPMGINANGQIVGSCINSADPFDRPHGFLWNSSTFSMIDYPGAARTEACGINDSGQIAGFAGVTHAFGFLKDTLFTPFEYAGASSTMPWGINDGGQIIGQYSEVVGSETLHHGFLKDGSTFSSFDYPDANYTYAHGINNNGKIVGYWQTLYSTGEGHGFLKDSAGFALIDHPDGVGGTHAYAVNDNDQIVGSYWDDAGAHGFMKEGTSFITIDYPGSLYTNATGINNDGVVVGYYFGSDGKDHGFVATPEVLEDTVHPIISFGDTCPVTVNLNSASTISVLVTDDDSGVASQSSPDGANALNAATVGLKTFTVTAMDNAGNETSNSCSYRVIYDFIGTGGFQSPIDNPPVLNTAKAGSTIPVKWQLPDGKGGFVSDIGVVILITFQQVSCADVSTSLTDPVETITAGSSGLRYDITNNQYNYNWKTSKTWAGKCYVLNLVLNDGSQYGANFKLR